MYRVLHPTQPNSGMFAFIWQTLRAMYHYPTDKYYVYFGRESCYFDEEMYHTQGIDNVWDCYFEQPHIDTRPYPSEIIGEVGILHDDFSEFRDIHMSNPEIYTQRRLEYNTIINKHVRLLPHVSTKVDEFYSENFKGHHVLGLHCRGTDHPNKLPMLSYLNTIDQYIDQYDKLFVTSDEQSRVDYIKKVYGDKVIEYPTFRSRTEAPLHYQSSHNWSKYYVGEDAIVEAYLLSKVNMLLCCTASNVNYFVRALNKDLLYKVINNII
jgi:hypothetical protein